MEVSEQIRILKDKIGDLLLKFEDNTGLEVVDIDIIDTDEGIPTVDLTIIDKNEM